MHMFNVYRFRQSRLYIEVIRCFCYLALLSTAHQKRKNCFQSEKLHRLKPFSKFLHFSSEFSVAVHTGGAELLIPTEPKIRLTIGRGN